MRYISGSFLIVLAFLVFGSTSAQAEVFYWEEPEANVSLTVPDTWRMIHDQKPDDVLTVTAPGHREYAECRLRIRQDRRFVVYPQRYSDEIQRKNFSYHFWESYVAEFDEGMLHKVVDDAGLGKGFGSYAEASFATNTGAKVFKRGIMFVSLYRDKAYILECSSEASVFTKWRNSFLSVAKSVDFDKVIHEFPQDHYRNFLGGNIRIHGERDVDTVYY